MKAALPRMDHRVAVVQKTAFDDLAQKNFVIAGIQFSGRLASEKGHGVRKDLAGRSIGDGLDSLKGILSRLETLGEMSEQLLLIGVEETERKGLGGLNRFED